MAITNDMIPVLPQYQRSPKNNVYSAVFPNEQHRVEIGRLRRYPGLLGAAPDTRALYDAAAQLLHGAHRVLDFGCGSGIGSAELRCHYDRVTAVDKDPEAVDFARAYLRSVSVLHDDGARPIDDAERHDGVVLIDVLGQSPSPEATLRRARRWLAPGGLMFVAEPRAYPSQALLSPVLRAFSPPGLASMLGRAGLEVERWIEGAGHFVVCLARCSASEDYRLLEEADAALSSGDPVRAMAAYAAADAGAARAVRTEALLGQAALLARAGDLGSACQAVLKAAALSPDDARSLASLSEISYAAGEQRQSLELAMGALERDPCDPGAVQCLARAAGTLLDDEAYASWRIANGLVPGDVGIATELARRAAGRSELGYAIWVLERLREFRRDLGVDYHVTLAWLYVTAERIGDARLEAELARVMDPESAGVKELWEQLAS
jgi:2-polyprenyl-3-methyl-5-hydroxy-6-metoxy-1,4-benzoquinol methylase